MLTFHTQRDLTENVWHTTSTIEEGHSCPKPLVFTSSFVILLFQAEKEKSLHHQAIDKAETSLQELKQKCTQMESKVTDQENELAKTKEQNNVYSSEITQCKELIK